MLDTLSRIHQLDENSNGDMSFLIARLELLASTSGAAVLYVHHTSKSGARDGLLNQQQAARGASALIDTARWCGYPARMTEDQAKRFIDPQSSPAAIGADRRSAFLGLGVSKQNNNAAPLAQWLERQEDGVLHPVTLQQGASKGRDTRRLVDGSNLTHARHAPMHCLAPALFRSLKRGDRKKLKLDVTYRYGDDECARFIGFEPLGADDMRLLQGLVALAGPNGVILTAAPTEDLPKQLRLGLSPKLDAKDSDGLVVRHHITRLMAEIGWHDSGENIHTVKASLAPMSNAIHHRQRPTSRLFPLDELCVRCRGQQALRVPEPADRRGRAGTPAPLAHRPE